MKMKSVGALEYECKLCGEVFHINYSLTKTRLIKHGEMTMEVKPDLADLFLHMWVHEFQQGDEKNESQSD